MISTLLAAMILVSNISADCPLPLSGERIVYEVENQDEAAVSPRKPLLLDKFTLGVIHKELVLASWRDPWRGEACWRGMIGPWGGWLPPAPCSACTNRWLDCLQCADDKAHNGIGNVGNELIACDDKFGPDGW